jgi:hypothetical protein
MSVQVSRDINTQPFLLGGHPVSKHDGTILQDAGRSAALAPFTVMAQVPSSLKFVPLTDVDPTITVAKMVCGANGANLAAWQAVTDGEFKISVDGVEISVTGLDFSSITALDEIVDTINAVFLGRCVAIYDSKADVVSFISPTPGLNGSVTVLTAGAAGTDISGAGFLNGLTGTGTATAGAGDDGQNLPYGIYMGPSITAAALVAGDVSDSPILIGGTGALVDENQIVLENSLTLDSVVISKNATIRGVLEARGIVPKDSVDISSYQA